MNPIDLLSMAIMAVIAVLIALAVYENKNNRKGR